MEATRVRLRFILEKMIETDAWLTFISNKELSRVSLSLFSPAQLESTFVID